MGTRVIKIQGKKKTGLEEAAAFIKKGGIVAFPTETVYGLGVDAFNQEAVQALFQVKGRPSDNPLIIHVSKMEMVYHLISSRIDEKVQRVLDVFWPGPLTVILPAASCIPKITTGGLPTVAIRMPDHSMALDLITASGTPIAAPSANLSGKPSGTTAGHVLHDFDGHIHALIDGGRSTIGLESTVVDFSGETPVLLRPGGLTIEELSSVIHEELGWDLLIETGREEKDVVKSPGMKYTHYAPNVPVVLIEGDDGILRARKIWEMKREYEEKGQRVGLLLLEDTFALLKKTRGLPDASWIKVLGQQAMQVGRNLFYLLRLFDEEDVTIVLAEGMKTEGLGFTIMNRLRKAASFHIVQV